MARIYAELQIAGRCCEVLHSEHGLYQPIDQIGRPNSTVHVNRIKVWLAGPGLADSLWPSWSFDPYRRLSGRLVFYEEEGRTSSRLVFRDAYCIHYGVLFDARGTRAGWPSLVVALHLSAAAVELDGQLIEAHSVLPWATAQATRLRALTKAPEPLPSPELRAGSQPSTNAPRPVGGRGPTGLGDTKGVHSGRRYDLERAGGGIQQLHWQSATITKEGIALLKDHVRRFGNNPENTEMIERLEAIERGELAITDWDKRYYTHEIREFERYRNLDVPDGEEPVNAHEAYKVWNDTHTATLEDYQLSDYDTTGQHNLYHPDIAKKYDLNR